jgi:N-acetyl-beta-hexosaminidase
MLGHCGRGFLALVVFAAFLAILPSIAVAGGPVPIPPPKHHIAGEGQHRLDSVNLTEDDSVEGNESYILVMALHGMGIAFSEDGVDVRLSIGPVEVETASRHADMIREQAYRIVVDESGIQVTGVSSQGLYYGVRTLEQLIDDKVIGYQEIVDWPDLPIRMLMVDLARQNENQEYYGRVIEFAGRYKINAILCHLTDDQTSALFHHEYSPLMHEEAWLPEDVFNLAHLASTHHIELIPEIESLGHSRMFERMPGFEEYLHQTRSDRPDQSWMGTDIPGYTNVLCPASPKAIGYLEAMYDRAAELFPHPWLHVGFDEVDMAECARCMEKFGEQTHDEWLATALRQAIDIAKKNDRTAALWGDMLLSHKAVVDSLSPDEVIIFDWYYRPDVTDDSSSYFAQRGFEVIACPALVAAPHMVIPDHRNYENIAKFTAIAREQDLLGVNTTIWVPTRYMSDVLWTGIAFAASHAWGGSNQSDEQFAAAFLHDHFGSQEGAAFHAAWSELAAVEWYRPDFYAAMWIDDDSRAAAVEIAAKRQKELEEKLATLERIGAELRRIGTTVKRNDMDWKALEEAVAITAFSMRLLQAAPTITEDPALLAGLAMECVRLSAMIEADWDKNRFADDPGKDGRFLANQHLLHRFRLVKANLSRLESQTSDS